MRKLSASCLLVLLPFAAAAQQTCPDGSSLATTGIRFVDDVGVAEIHRQTAPNTVTVTIIDGEYQSQNILAHGVHVLQLADLENGQVVPDSVWEFSYPVDNAKLPRPTPNGTWAADTTYVFMGDRDSERVEHTWGSITRHQIGSCAYDAIPVRIEYTSEFYDHVEELLYFPSLGTALLTVYEDDEGRDVYTHVQVSLP